LLIRVELVALDENFNVVNDVKEVAALEADNAADFVHPQVIMPLITPDNDSIL